MKLKIITYVLFKSQMKRFISTFFVEIWCIEWLEIRNYSSSFESPQSWSKITVSLDERKSPYANFDSYSKVPNKRAAGFIIFLDFFLLTYMTFCMLLISEKPATYSVFYIMNIKNSHVHALINTSTFILFWGNLTLTSL